VVSRSLLHHALGHEDVAGAAGNFRLPACSFTLVLLTLAACGGDVASTAAGARTILPPVAADSIANLIAAAGAPQPANLASFVRNQEVAIQLGKALFWEMQTGGDGQQACATCHHSAGADSRIVNTVHAGPRAVGVARGAPLLTVPDGTLTTAMFPLPLGVNDVVASQGVVSTNFLGIDLGSAVDQGIAIVDPVFGTSRQVMSRNAATVIDAVFNLTNFWDGRASQIFNGVNISGAPATLNVDDGAGIVSFPVPVIQPASLASQALGPPNNSVEMSWGGRTFPELGRKLLNLKPLGKQVVHQQDSVLGNLSAQRDLSDFAGLGLTTSYRQMIMDAFQDRFWNSTGTVTIVTRGTPTDFSLMEANFSLFWGLSIQLYTSILVSNQTPFDSGTMTARQLAGQTLFNTTGRCNQCHAAPRFTSAAIDMGALPAVQFVGAANAFRNIGVSPIAEDTGVVASAAATAGVAPGNAKFKTPGLRNAELTGPYFHNGRPGTLRQVVDFYERGGDFPVVGITAIIPLVGLTVSDKEALVDFMLALTDERVRMERAPFDHPSLDLPNGASLPAVGMNGGAGIARFLGLDPFAP
jgi:cytochrome c peroxidase